MPFPATDRNRGKLEKWIRGCYSASAINNCHHQPLEEMGGKHQDIAFKEGAEPVVVNMPVSILHHW